MNRVRLIVGVQVELCVCGMFVSFNEIILMDNKKKQQNNNTQTGHTRLVLSALAKIVPAKLQPAKSGQADGSNERSAKIIQ